MGLEVASINELVLLKTKAKKLIKKEGWQRRCHIFPFLNLSCQII
jgi:hypothetical protein